MRLLSQDGTINVPYDQVMVSIEGTKEVCQICIRMIGDLKSTVMAVYPHYYQAFFAMKYLNLKYNTYNADGITTFHFPSAEEVKRMMGEA